MCLIDDENKEDNVFVHASEFDGSKKLFMNHHENRAEIALDPFRILDNCPFPVLQVMANGEIVYANKASGIFTGSFANTNKRIIPQAWAPFFKEALGSKKRITRIFEENPRVFEFEFVPAATQQVVTIYAYDVTEREAQKAETARLKTFYESALDAMPAELAVFDAEARYQYVSPSGVKSKAMRDWFIGKNDLDYCELRNIDPDVGQQRMEKLLSVARTKKAIEFEESMVSRVTGKTLHYIRHIKPVMDDDGEVILLLGFGLNITEQKEAELALQESEEKYRQLVEEAGDLIYQIDDEGKLLFVSSMGDDFLGTSAEKLVGQKVYQFIHPDYRERIKTFYQVQFIDQLQSSYIEFPIIRADGKTIWVGQQVELTEDNIEGNRLTAVARDITRQKKLEDQLRYQKAMLEAQQGASIDGILVVDEQGNWCSYNNKMLEMWGIKENGQITSEDALGVVRDLVVDFEAFSSRIKSLYADKNKSGYDEIVLKDGRFFERHTSPVYGDEGEYFGRIWSYRDITARKRTELALRISESRKDGILTSALDAIITIDEHSAILEYNPAAERIFGFKQDEVLGLPMFDFIVPPQYRDAHKRGMDHFMATGEGPVIGNRIEITAIHADGHEFPIELAITSIPIDGQQYFTAYVRDITDRKETEHKLIEAKELAENSAKAKETFLANMSHEIRTPLNAVIGLSHLLQNTSLSAQQDRYVSGIKYSADNLLNLINGILDLTKLEADMISYESVPFGLSHLIAKLYETHRFKAEEKGIQLNVHIDKECDRVYSGDPFRINQVLANLLSNALKYTERGQIAILVDLVQSDGEADIIQFQVQDTGIGIYEDQLDKIFDVFTQARSDSARIYGGTGLGLSIVKKLIDGMHGAITVNSEPGVGSTFTASIPLKPADAHIEFEEKEEANLLKDLSGLCILVVEDNEMNRLVVCEMLLNWQCAVLVAQDGHQAIALLRKHQVDLVLMDIQMPEMDGYETTHYIRTELKLDKEELPIIALTASALIEQRTQAIEVGMNDFVSKPFNPQDLFEKMVSFSNRTTPSSISEQGDAADNESLVLFTQFHSISTDALHAQTGNDANLQAKLIHLFNQKSEQFMLDLQDAYNTSDFSAIGFLSHKMKSSAAMLGAMTLHNQLKDLEGLIHTGQSNEVKQEHIVNIKKEVVDVNAELKQFLSTYTAY